MLHFGKCTNISSLLTNEQSDRLINTHKMSHIILGVGFDFLSCSGAMDRYYHRYKSVVSSLKSCEIVHNYVMIG